MGFHGGSDLCVQLCQPRWIAAARPVGRGACFAHQQACRKISVGWRHRRRGRRRCRGRRGWRRGRRCRRRGGRRRGWRRGWRGGWRGGRLQGRGLLSPTMPYVVVICVILLLAGCMECPPVSTASIHCCAVVRLLAAQLRLFQSLARSSAASRTESIAAPVLVRVFAAILGIMAHPLQVRLQPLSRVCLTVRFQAEAHVWSDTMT